MIQKHNILINIIILCNLSSNLQLLLFPLFSGFMHILQLSSYSTVLDADQTHVKWRKSRVIFFAGLVGSVLIINVLDSEPSCEKKSLVVRSTDTALLKNIRSVICMVIQTLQELVSTIHALHPALFS